MRWFALTRTYSVRLQPEQAGQVKDVVEKEKQRNEREKRKPPTTSEILVMLVKLGLEAYYARNQR